MQSPTEQFADFLGQLPIAPFAMICGSALLLMFFTFWIGYWRPSRKKKNEIKQSMGSQPDLVTNPVPTSVMPPAPVENMPETEVSMSDPMDSLDELDSMADLPDLASLLDTSALVEDEMELVETEAMSEVATYSEPVIPVPVESENQPPSEPGTSATPVPPVVTRNNSSAPELSPGKKLVRMESGTMIPAEQLVTVLRDPRDGRLVVQIDEVGYRTLLDSPEVKKQFVKIMKELSTVITEPDDNPPVATEHETASIVGIDQTPEVPAMNTQQPPAAIPMQPQSAVASPPSTPQRSVKKGALPGDLPDYKIEDSVKPQQGGIFSGRPKYEAAPVPELNIAGAIEAYLQYKLQQTGAYPGREIHIHSAPGGGVRIQVDETFYEAVGDVADSEVRSFISSAIQEWQERQ